MGVGAELDIVSANPTLKLAVLVGPMEAPGEDIAALANLDLLQRAAGILRIVGVDGPVAGEVLCGRVVADAIALRWAAGRRTWSTLESVAVGKVGGQAELLVRLNQQLFGSARVATKVIVIVTLSLADTFKCLHDGLLR